jgi:hypothetical protein
MRQTGGPQLAMVVDDPAVVERERQRELDDERLLFERLMKACREVCRELGYDRCAAELDAIWSPLGRHVSAGVLRQTLAPNTERNYFRLEWIIWFARQSEEVADLVLEVIGRGRPKKKPEDELRDLKELIRAELPKRAAALIRKAEM